jgi:carbohydrate kinase (thermoresistant glucokinase family)
MRIVVMGVSGCGKSTLGRALADALHQHYVEGDTLHSSANVERMAAGIALTDADRHDWLQAVAGQLGNATASSAGVVVSCSALKRAYRDQLRRSAADTRFVHLHGDPALLAQRMSARQGHYMPTSLLQSQLDTLEPPGDDERPIRLDIAWPLERQLSEALQRLADSTPPTPPSAP